MNRASVLSMICWMCAMECAHGNVVSPVVGHEVRWDDNLFRIPQQAAPTSERVDITTAGLSLEKEYSLQKVYLRGDLVANRYSTLNYLNFNAFNYAAMWQFALGPWMRGITSIERKQDLNSFADFRSYNVRNVRTEKVANLEVEANLGGAAYLFSGLQERDKTNEVPGVLDGDRRMDSASAGLRYLFPSGSTLSYRLRKSTGESNSVQDVANMAFLRRFDERSHEMQALWLVSGKTTVAGNVGYVSRTYPDVPAIRFGGPVADVSVKWNVTAKTSVDAVLRRELYSYQSDFSDYVVSNRILLRPTWKATSRTSVFANVEFAQRSFRNSVQKNFSDLDRRDAFRVFALGVEWKPIDALVISVLAQKLVNDSNYPAFRYTSNGAYVSAKFRFH